MKKTITSLAVLLLAGAFFAGTAFALSADRSAADDENIKIDDKTEFVRGDIEKEISFSSAACSNGISYKISSRSRSTCFFISSICSHPFVSSKWNLRR